MCHMQVSGIQKFKEIFQIFLVYAYQLLIHVVCYYKVVWYLEAWVVLDSKNVVYDQNSYLGLLWQRDKGAK